MGDIAFTFYTGNIYENVICVLIPRHPEYLSAFWAYCKSGLFTSSVRALNQKLSVDVRYFEKAEFDLAHWQRIANEIFPDGLPKPHSNDPTQWLFHGHPVDSCHGTTLHVALARLAGYRWPAETDTTMHLSPESREWVNRASVLSAGDKDGILCLPALSGEAALADRLRAMLAAAFGTEWSDATERRLITEADGTDGMGLESWLRTRFFRSHCTLFGQRPFLWHITDGLRDGFSAILHYHRLTRATLEKLTYTVLNDWIARMQATGQEVHVERAKLLQSKLAAILEGEAPYDIFVRWKSLAQQPLGWDPDLDDGVRMNIRPFMEAGILAWQPNIKWTKDRGADATSAPWYPVDKGERINDHHTTLAEKRAARAAAGAA